MVVLMCVCAGVKADDGKVDPAKLYREKREAERALAASEKSVESLRVEVARLKGEVDAAAERAKSQQAIRAALATLAKVEPHIAEVMTDDELLAVALPPKGTTPEDVKLAAKIRWCITNHVVTEGMTEEDVKAALLAVPFTRSKSDDGSENVVWAVKWTKITSVRTIASKSLEHTPVYEVRMLGGKVFSYVKLRDWFKGD